MSLSKVLAQKKDILLQDSEVVKIRDVQEKDLLGYVKKLEIRIEKLESKRILNVNSRG